MLSSLFGSRILGSLRLYSTKKKASPKKVAQVKLPQVMLSADATESSEDLKELADFLSRTFINGGIKSAVHPDFGIGSVQTQLKKTDEMGVIYSVVLKNSTLTDGILGIKHIETVLPEQVHISTIKSNLKILLRLSDHSSQ